MKKMLIRWIAIAGWITLSTARAADLPYELVEAWASDPVLDVPESALFNPGENLLYVSNVSGGPFEKNGKGFISKVDLNGQVVEMKWAVGLNAPKGMALLGDYLYVTDIDRLVQIDLNSGQTVRSYPAKDAVSLNDVAVDSDGILYVSDSRATQCVLHRLMKNQLVPWFDFSELGNMNGLYMEGDRLLAGQSKDGALYAIDLKTGKKTVIGKIDTGIDGLKPDGRGRYFTSNWAGRITLITPTGTGTTLLDTTAEGINKADFEYLPEQALLIVPTFHDNRLVAYKAVPTSD